MEACDLGTGSGFDHVTYAEATGEGFVQVDMPVRQLITTPRTGLVDCASSPERCLVAVGAVGDYEGSGGASVGFVGQPPFAVPALTVSVPGPYEPGQLVDVAASGLLAPREVQIQICQVERCVPLVRGRVAVDGTIASPVELPWSFVPADGAVVACDLGCELRLAYLALPGSSQAPVPAAVPIEFTAVDEAAPPVPATVAPTTVALTTVPPSTVSPGTLVPIDDVTATTTLAVAPTTAG